MWDWFETITGKVSTCTQLRRSCSPVAVSVLHSFYISILLTCSLLGTRVFHFPKSLNSLFFHKQAVVPGKAAVFLLVWFCVGLIWKYRLSILLFTAVGLRKKIEMYWAGWVPQYLQCACVFAVLSVFPDNFIPLSSIFTFLLVLEDIILTFIPVVQEPVLSLEHSVQLDIQCFSCAAFQCPELILLDLHLFWNILQLSKGKYLTGSFSHLFWTQSKKPQPNAQTEY